MPTTLRGMLLEMGRIGGVDKTRASQLRASAVALVQEDPTEVFSLLQNRNQEIVLGALHVIAEAGVKNPPPLVYHLAASSSVGGIRYNALLAAANGPPSHASSTLLNQLGHHPEDLAFVVEAMERHPRDDYVPFLGGLVWSDPEGPATVRAISALGNVHSDVGRSMLASLLAHPDAELSRLAAYALHSSPPKDLGVLQPFLTHTRASVRAAAVLVLPSVPGVDAEALLQRHAQDVSSDVREAAAEALEDLKANPRPRP